MRITTTESDGAQMGVVLTAGNGATSEKLMELRHQISLTSEIASQYVVLTIRDQNARVFFVDYFITQLKYSNELLKEYIVKLKQGKCMMAFCISTGRYREEPFWMWCDKMCSDMIHQELYGRLKDNLALLKKLLTDSEDTIRHCNPALFEKFFFDEEQNYSNDGVRKRFDEWMFDNLNPGIEKLRQLQALVVAEALKKGLLDFAPVPSQKEIDEVNRDTLKGLLPYDFEMTADFIVACAKWRRFMHWQEPLLIIDYQKYGKYIQNHYFDFNPEQLQAIFELDMMVHLINEELARLNQVSTITITNHVPEEELFKFIHPSISGEEEWQIHEEVKRLVGKHGIPEICEYLYQMSQKKTILLPKMSSVTYVELVRMGMPTGKGYSEKYFYKFYRK